MMVHGKFPGFTPAAERTVQWCRQLLPYAGSVDDRAALLVLALLHDESLAAACLQDLGVTIDWLRSGALGPAVAGVLQTGLPQRLESEGSGCGPQRSLVLDEDPADFQAVLQHARELARRESSDQAITSSLLLLALPVQNVFIRERLAERGGTWDVLRGRLLGESNVVVERLAVDEPLQWSTPASTVSGADGGKCGIGADVAAESSGGSFPEFAILRAVDACLNRAREGLRVLEDCARFIWNNPALCAELKSVRHELASGEQRLRAKTDRGGASLLQTRDTAGDVGTAVTNPGERTRASLQQLVLANARRVQESLRSLEEFGKLLDPEFAAAMKQLRYRSYIAEQQLAGQAEQPGLRGGLHSLSAAFAAPGSAGEAGNQRSQRLHRLQQAVVYVLITESQCRLPWLETARQALEGGADVLQLREKQLADRELLQRAKQLGQLCRDAGALFIMNDRPDLAMAAEADGVHVGQQELTAPEIRRLGDWNGLIGVSTHSRQQLLQAFADGADYVGVGPVFPSGTKSFADFPGLSFVTEAAAAAAGPWFAIGGISPERLPDLRAAGASRIAVTAAVTQSADPAAAVRKLKSALKA